MNAIEWLKEISFWVPWLLGAFTIFNWLKTPKSPNDSSNRINNIVSWWIGTTRPHVLGRCYKFFRQDVMDNINDVEKSSNED